MNTTRHFSVPENKYRPAAGTEASRRHSLPTNPEPNFGQSSSWIASRSTSVTMTGEINILSWTNRRTGLHSRVSMHGPRSCGVSITKKGSFSEHFPRRRLTIPCHPRFYTNQEAKDRRQKSILFSFPYLFIDRR